MSSSRFFATPEFDPRVGVSLARSYYSLDFSGSQLAFSFPFSLLRPTIAQEAPNPVQARIAARGPATRLLASFEDKNPFSGGTVVVEHATDGAKALRLDRGYAAWDAPQDWSGYDYLKADIFSDSEGPTSLHIEMRDRSTRDYWTRLNYETMLPPGKSTLVLPLAQLYVGEKARPGRKLLLNAITQFVVGIDEKSSAPIYIDNIRLDRDVETSKAMFKGLSAYSFGPADGPLMPGFTRVDPSTVYSKGRGFGLKNAQIWRH